MTAFTLPAHTRIAAVTLRTADLDRALRFYAEGVGLLPQSTPDGAALSAPGDTAPILYLRADPTAPPRPRRAVGLYHTAIRLPTRAALAGVLRRLAGQQIPFDGFSDHTVSEALYLPDFDGLGVELYRDRPRAEWHMAPDGQQVEMTTTALDLDDLLSAAPDPAPAPAGTDIGHIHLHVADLRRAEAFYCDLLGFTVMQRTYPGALFVAAGGYHHHIGLNTWAGTAAPPPGAVGLVEVQIAVGDASVVTALADRAVAAGHPVERTAAGLRLTDADGNGVQVSV